MGCGGVGSARQPPFGKKLNVRMLELERRFGMSVIGIEGERMLFPRTGGVPEAVVWYWGDSRCSNDWRHWSGWYCDDGF